MKRTLLAGALLLSSTALVSAADMAAKSASPTPAPGFSWTGFYVGGNAGYGNNSGGVDSGGQTYYANTSGDTGTETHGPGGPAWMTKESLNGFVGGAQAGYNFQMGHVVLGAEADFSAGNLIGSSSASNTTAINLLPFPPGGPNLWPVTGNMTSAEKVDWFGTVRGRLGFTSGDALVYGTGGLAYGHVSDTFCYSGGFLADAALGFGGSHWSGCNSSSSTKTGWTAGAGLEYSLRSIGLAKWSVRGEWLHVDLGDVETDMTAPAFRNSNGTGGRSVNASNFSDAKFDVFRGGINYRF